MGSQYPIFAEIPSGSGLANWPNSVHTLGVDSTLYTAEMMVREAHNRGFNRNVSARLIYDWASLGLLDYPARSGRGRGHKSRWSEEQFQLFLLLLEKRQGAKRITPLFNIPTCLWLYWGDRYASLGQIRRALGNWGRAVLRPWGHTSTGVMVDSRKAARHLMNQLIYPLKTIPGSRKVLRQLTEVIYSRQINRTNLVPIIQQIVSASGKAKTEGPAAHLFNVENIALQIVAGSEAINHLNEISDGTFEWSRRMININNREYARDQPQLARDVHLGHFFYKLDDETILNRACEDLAQALGATRLGLPADAKDSLRDPALWDSLQLTMQGGEVKTRSGLIIPSRV